jgi:hypothetical protein
MAPVRGGAQMIGRKGEITLPEIKHKWPYHVALPADKVRGARNSQIVWSLQRLCQHGRGRIPCAATKATSWCFALPSRRTLRHSVSNSAGSACRVTTAHDDNAPQLGATLGARVACKQPPWCQCRALLVYGHGFKRHVLAGLFRGKIAAAEREVAGLAAVSRESSLVVI